MLPTGLSTPSLLGEGKTLTPGVKASPPAVAALVPYDTCTATEGISVLISMAVVMVLLEVVAV